MKSHATNNLKGFAMLDIHPNEPTREFRLQGTVKDYFHETYKPYKLHVYGPIDNGFGKVKEIKVQQTIDVLDLLDLISGTDDYWLVKIIDYYGTFKCIEKGAK